jgi:hypothetical protein
LVRPKPPQWTHQSERKKNQGCNRYLKIPGEKLEIQWHTVLYSGDDNYQEKQKGDD